MRQPAEHSKAADPVEKRGIKEVHKPAEKRPAVKSDYRNARNQPKRASSHDDRKSKVTGKREREEDEESDDELVDELKEKTGKKEK